MEIELTRRWQTQNPLRNLLVAALLCLGLYVLDLQLFQGRHVAALSLMVSEIKRHFW
jgi:hypothetical protein